MQKGGSQMLPSCDIVGVCGTGADAELTVVRHDPNGPPVTTYRGSPVSPLRPLDLRPGWVLVWGGEAVLPRLGGFNSAHRVIDMELWVRVAFPGREREGLAAAEGEMSSAEQLLRQTEAVYEKLRALPSGVHDDLARLFGSEWLSFKIQPDASARPSPLDRPEGEPPADRQPASALNVPWDADRLIHPDGPLASQFPRFEVRPAQEKMMAAVKDALTDGSLLLAEAGTGTGKSLAYLVPTLLESARSGERVVIATHTLALQEQLWNKDLPPVRSVVPVEAALLKGKGRYLCLLKLDEIRRQASPLVDSRERRALLAELIAFAHADEGGDVDAFSPRGEAARGLWEEVVADRHACRGPRCPFAGPCFMRKSRREAEHAHVLVVNHALLAAHLAQGGVLPEFQHVVIDEAHHFDQAAERAFGLDVGLDELAASLNEMIRTGQLERLKSQPELFLSLDRLGERLAVVATLALALARALWNETAWGDWDRQSTRLTSPWHEQWADAPAGLHFEPFVQALSETARAGLDVWALGESILGPVMTEEPGWLRYQKWLDEFSHVAQGLEGWGDGDPAWVDWWVAERSGPVRLCRAPLEVGELVRRSLWDTVHAAVLTSATLSVNGDFSFLSQTLGIAPERLSTLRLDSPFDLKRQARLFVPIDRAEVDSLQHVDESADFIARAATALGGRTLVLLNSHRALRRLAAALRPRLELRGIETLAQGPDGSGAGVVRRFMHTPRAVLLGAASLWEGLDVPGPRLSLVIIARLPFSAPGDPLESARRELVERAGRSAFYERSLPEAILKFRQGFGRLLRSASDRGAVVVLDSRILPQNRRYGARFLRAVRPAPVRVGTGDALIAEIEAFFLSEGDDAHFAQQ